MANWYLRNTAGKVFGPIALDTLQAWVKDGRVEPFAGVSQDLKSWCLAPLVPELEMNWIVENNPGQFYGPTHRDVLDDLMKAGQLSRDARFYQDDRGALQARLAAREAELAAKDMELSRRDVALEDAQKQMAKRDLALAAAQQAVEQRDARLAETQTVLAEKESQIESYSKAIKDKESDLIRAANELASLKMEVERLTQRLTEKEADLADLRKQIEESTQVRERSWCTEVVEPVVVDELPPPVAREAFGFGGQNAVQRSNGSSSTSLADLERRAQEELARMSAAGLNVSSMFKFGKK